MGIEHRLVSERWKTQLPDPDTSDGRAVIHHLHSNRLGLKDVRGRMRTENSTAPLSSELTIKLSKLEFYLAQLADKAGRSMVTLAPVSPRGLVAALTKTDPLKIAHATGRPFDVVSDPTIDLTYVAYLDRQVNGELEPISLGTIQRCLRLQRYENPNYTQHFSMFGTLDATIGYDRSKNFSIDVISCLVSFYSHALRNIGIDQPLEVAISHIGIAEKYRQMYGNPSQRPEVLTSSASMFDQFDFDEACSHLDSLDVGRELAQIQRLGTVLAETALADDISVSVQLLRPSGSGHYNGLVFYILMPDGNDVADGGSVNWLSELTANRKEFTVVSGLGTQLLATQYMK